MGIELEQLHDVTERLERAEDDFLALIERYPHLISDPQTVAIIQVMKSAISDLRAVTPPS